MAFYDIGYPNSVVADDLADQLSVTSTILNLMGLEIPDVMQVKPLY